MNELGAANVVINGTDATGPAFNSVNSGLRGVGTEAERAGAKLVGSGKSLVESLQRQAEAIGKTRSEVAAFQAQQLGVAEAAAPYIARIRAAEQGTTRLGVSAAQTANALRGVPAQFTDIVTSLQGGQAPLTVFLQQGGQLKDMFGGIGPAARALGGYIGGLINPLTVGATAVAALSVAMYQGSQESQEYAKALLLTGNYLGKTTDQLKEQAAQIARTTGTQGEAAEALARMTQGGKIAASAMTEVGTAVVTMDRVLGQSVDSATAVFEKLAEEPSKASAKLNEQMHYLTQATYDRIRALEEQGKSEEAAALAQITYANATTTRLQQVESQAGVLVRAWRALAHDAKEAWDMMQGLGRQQTTNELLAAAQQRLADRQARGPLNDQTRAAYDKGLAKDRAEALSISLRSLRESDNAFAEGERTRAESAKIAASNRLKTLSDEVRSNADKRKKALADLDRDYKTLGKPTSGSEYDKQVANINDKYKDPKGAKAQAFRDDAATRMLEQLRQQSAATSAELATAEKLTSAEGKRAEFNQLIADLKGKDQLTADQKSLVAAQDSIRAQLDVNVALEKQVATKKAAAEADKKQLQAAKEFKDLIEATNIRMEEAAKGQKEQYDRQLDVFGLGNQAAERLQSTKGIYKEYANFQAGLAVSAAKRGTLGSEEYQNEVAKIQQSLQEALKLNTDFYAQLDVKRADWTNGASAALQNYLDGVKDVAKGTEEAFTSAFKGAEDGLVSLITTGKTNGKDLLKSLAEQGVRQFVRQGITGPAAEALQSSGILGVGKGAGETSATAATSAFALSLKTGTTTASSALGELTRAAYASAASLGGAGRISVGNGSLDLLAGVASSMSGDSLDNFLNLTGAFGTFAVGTDFVPHDMYAKIHKGEAVVRAADNTAARHAGGPTQNYFNVGDLATASMVRKAIADSERRVAGGAMRSQRYGGSFGT